MSEVKEKLLSMVKELNDAHCEKTIRYINDLLEDEKMTPEDRKRQIQEAFDTIAIQMQKAMCQAKAGR